MTDTTITTTEAPSEGIFSPSTDQIRTKAVYHTRTNSEDTTLAHAITVTGDSRLRRWWSESFSTWFFNNSAFEEELEGLVQEIPKTLRDILADDGPQLSTKLNAVKLIGELAGLFKDSSDKKDKKTYTKEELRKIIQAKGGHLLKAAKGGTP